MLQELAKRGYKPMGMRQEMTETEDAEGNIILIERIDGSGGVRVHG